MKMVRMRCWRRHRVASLRL